VDALALEAAPPIKAVPDARSVSGLGRNPATDPGAGPGLDPDSSHGGDEGGEAVLRRLLARWPAEALPDGADPPATPGPDPASSAPSP